MSVHSVEALIACNTKLYPIEWYCLGRSSYDAAPENPVRTTLADPVVRLLLLNCNLTRTQFETLLIDHFWRQFSDQIAPLPRKQAFRSGKRRVSRGAFNRTLVQARNNVVRSIYTLFLLGYVGLFDSPKLEPFIEVADQIRTFVETRSASSTNASKETMGLLAQSLDDVLHQLASGKSFVDRL